eukprot:NODE_786_length_4265_cov_0.251320.p3 type:complete len:125 gc:universal NODE_786_length_4265_cov_0.251320:2741-3115(+)
MHINWFSKLYFRAISFNDCASSILIPCSNTTTTLSNFFGKDACVEVMYDANELAKSLTELGSTYDLDKYDCVSFHICMDSSFITEILWYLHSNSYHCATKNSDLLLKVLCRFNSCSVSSNTCAL